MGLPAERVIPLPMDEPHVIDGVTVTLMDANHCPGACMMLFKVPVKGSKPQVNEQCCLSLVVNKYAHLHVSDAMLLWQQVSRSMSNAGSPCCPVNVLSCK